MIFIKPYFIQNSIPFRLLLFCCFPWLWNSCADNVNQGNDSADSNPIVLSSAGIDAAGPFFTSDRKGAAVVVWSEKLMGGDSTGYVMKYSRLSKDGSEVLSTNEIGPSRGCATAGESVNKIAFKENGTMVAVYARREATLANRFAGALYYTQSFDEGRNWTPESYLHVGDTTSGLSRSFFDIATLSDGEVGAIWLDSRMKKNQEGEGSTLFFAKTVGDHGFKTDQAIGTGTCECCRTELFVSRNGDIHALYRDIWSDSIRDISHVISTDHGNTFSQPVRISTDDWVIYGCPHTGPSVSEYNGELNIAWFTMGGIPGLYQTRFSPQDHAYLPKKLLSANGRHPQVLTIGNDQLVYLWEESEDSGQYSNHINHDAPVSAISLKSFSAPTSFIKAQIWKDGNPIREHWVSPTDHFAQFPVGIGLTDGYVGISWMQQNEDGSDSILYRRIRG